MLHTLGTVVSADGTTIGYRQMGSGPGLILVHGGMMAAQNFMKLGERLSSTFTVFIPDRRGRGTSGPFGSDYSVAKDVEDVRALLEKTNAHDVFGLSAGAVIALESALAVSSIERVAAYEPPFGVDGYDTAHWRPRFDREIERGQLGAAMVTIMKGTGDSRLLRAIPSFALAPIVGAGIRADEKSVAAGDVPIGALIPTMHYDAQIVAACSANLERFRKLDARLRLLGGSKSARYLKRALDALESLLPNATRVELRGVGHLAADNRGKPEVVAAELRSFFVRR